MTWWGRPDDGAGRALVERLRGVLPAPAEAETRAVKLGSNVDSLLVAEALRGEPGFLWLDCAGAASRLFTDPLVTLEVKNGELTARGAGGVIRVEAGGFDVLEAALEAWAGPGGALLVGYLGYDLAAELERLPALPPDPDRVPDLHLALYDAHWRHEAGEWTYVSTEAWRARNVVEPPSKAGEAPAGPLSSGPVTSLPGAAGFEDAVRRTVDRIYAGELFQTNLCRRLEAPLADVAVWPLYRRLREVNPARFGAYVPLGAGRAVLSNSPELYLRVEGGRVSSSPIKGTRPRGATPEENVRMEAELTDSVKDRAELAMIVDVVRNDLARVCEPGSVVVEAHAELMRLPTLTHTVSTVSGLLRGGIGGLLRASFPPASISGAPKIHAMEVAMAEEQRRRGPCMGSIGWISMDGRAELSVAIRTAVVAGGRVRYETGCGITAQSDPAQELAETRHKARAFLSALGCGERE
ncbi:anthranilate synthase component I family protein [Paludibaculum fermentans]|uniref:Anthranilate synthase component I family protein n=1 Tax=Paludibaculum fermentans TaxID=1473598 RepID=A0A7S7NSL9_PALFE|nr:anthranilate synthase component I family protein [Paludibaculum fermentans]QOY89037.1 anthranilate synthase component I family protein [Paludibaculum fermentans]